MKTFNPMIIKANISNLNVTLYEGAMTFGSFSGEQIQAFYETSESDQQFLKVCSCLMMRLN
jgi:hypothetical protein